MKNETVAQGIEKRNEKRHVTMEREDAAMCVLGGRIGIEPTEYSADFLSKRASKHV